MRCGIWLKNDLRLEDNPLFALALKTGLELVPFFCLDPAMFQPDDFGLRRCGSFRAAFLLDSLRKLEQSLRSKNAGLIVCPEAANTAIPRLAKAWNFSCILTSGEFGTEETGLMDSIEEVLTKSGCRLIRTPREYLLPEQKLPFPLEKVPDGFTSYRLKTEHIPLSRPLLPAPQTLPAPEIPPAEFPALPVPGLKKLEKDPRTAFPFAAGEQAAQNRLRYYALESGLLSEYKETRNGLLGSDFSSKFSPWLAHGSLSAGQILEAVLQYERLAGTNESTRWLIFELRWRDFFRLMLRKHGVRMFYFSGYQRKFSPPASRDLDRFQAWCRGETENAFVNAGMMELRLTGFLSNRMRQVVASYLIDYLHLDWRLGAAWFEEQLIDYDVSSNWGNWSYLAGVGSDPRGKRVFDPQRQANQYDPDGSYRNSWN